MLRDLWLSSMRVIATLCQILIKKELLILTLITIATLCGIGWLAILLSGIGLWLRSWWTVAHPDQVWLETTICGQDRGVKLERTHEWERSRILQAVGFAAMGTIGVLLSIGLFVFTEH